MSLPDCIIKDNGEVSSAFITKGILSFVAACAYIKNLPYGRNEDKDNVLAVFNDNRGTCSTKHATLKRLADENGIGEIRLITAIYKMNRINTPGIGDALEVNNLKYLPEAHNYLKVGSESFDFTFPHAKALGFEGEILEETVIMPHQVTAYKAELHKKFLSRWLLDNKNINLSLSALWQIREQCIANLSENKK